MELLEGVVSSCENKARIDFIYFRVITSTRRPSEDFKVPNGGGRYFGGLH